MPWVERFRRGPEAEPGAEEPPPPPAHELPAGETPIPPPGRMRRERGWLESRREIEIRDVGGLTVEMVRRDRFRPELLIERAGEVLALEERMLELDGLMFAASSVPRGTRTVQVCTCGAPILPGGHFCSHCGRPSPETPALVTCSNCGRALPADTKFCPACGHSVPADAASAGNDELDQTLIRRRSADEED